MKNLTQDQLENIVSEITLESFKKNKDVIIRNITESIEEGANCHAAFSASMTAYGIEIIKQFNQILIKTLYKIFMMEVNNTRDFSHGMNWHTYVNRKIINTVGTTEIYACGDSRLRGLRSRNLVVLVDEWFKMEVGKMSNISDEILKAIKYAIDRKTINCDKTYKSVIKSINSNGYVVLDNSGSERTVKCCIPEIDLKIGQGVCVKEPMGKISGLHICGVV